MTKPATSTCACPGCDHPRRERSKYCCERCQEKASRIKQRTARSVYAVTRKVIILDPKCAMPYTVPKSEFEQYRSKYLPGTKVIIDGCEMELNL